MESFTCPPYFQDARLRRSIETRICVSLAGDIAEDLLEPRSGFLPPTSDETAAEEVARAFAGLSLREGEVLERVERKTDFGPPDQESAARLAWAISGDEAIQHLAYLRAVTRSIVYSPSTRRGIAALADALLEREVVSGRAVRAILKSERR